MANAVTRDAAAPSGSGNAGTAVAIPLATLGEQGVLNEVAAGPQALSPRATGQPDELVEPCRALALADFTAPSVGPGERLIRFAYGMGVPASLLTSPLGKSQRTRILATVANPLPGSKVGGTALRAGHFLVNGAKTTIAQVDFGPTARLTPPLERVVHGFTWLPELEAAGPREQGAPVAERILAHWLDANGKPPSRPTKGSAWSVDNVGQRLLGWLVHAPLILSGNDRALRSRALTMISVTARWLDRNVTRADNQLGQIAGWCGIVAAGLLLPEGRPRRLFGETGLIRALGDLVGSDGGVLSRSPVDQIEAIVLLVRLRACYRAVRLDPPEALETMIALLVPPLLALTHGDGSLGSWQGAWAIDGEDISRLVAATGVRARPLRDVRQWGYQRVTTQKSVLLFDAAPPPLARNARYGCASTLAFELSHAGHRIIVNCGGSASAGGLLPIRLEQGLRASAAHSTLVLDDVNSTAVLINGGIGAGVSEVEIDRRIMDGERNAGATRLEGSHNGYVQRYGLNHRRILILRDDGAELRGEDLLVPSGRRGKRGKVNYAIRFHLGPGIEAGLTDDGTGAGIALPDGSYWQFRSSAGELTLEESLWVDGQGRPVAILQLVLQGLVSRGGGNFAWLLKRMG